MLKQNFLIILTSALIIFSLAFILISHKDEVEMMRKTRRTTPLDRGIREYLSSIRSRSALVGNEERGNIWNGNANENKFENNNENGFNEEGASLNNGNGPIVLGQQSTFFGREGSMQTGLTIWALGGIKLCLENCQLQETKCQMNRGDLCFKTSTTNFKLNHCKNWSHQICKADNNICRKECEGMAKLLGGPTTNTKPRNPKNELNASRMKPRSADIPINRRTSRPKILRKPGKNL